MPEYERCARCEGVRLRELRDRLAVRRGLSVRPVTGSGAEASRTSIRVGRW